MSVPGKRRSASAGKRRRAHQALKQPQLKKCPKCNKPILPHRVCLFCGSYQGREIIKIKIKKKKEKK